ncbi:MAG: thioredoxin-disulfide reductase [Emergencia sp.]
MYDIVIAGAGPAGLSAAIYGQRAGRRTLLIDAKGFGGQIVNTPEVENYPGIKKISGFEFAGSLYEQASELGAEIVFEKVTGIEKEAEKYIVVTESSRYETKTVILATGAKNRPLGLEKEEAFTGAGVSYCATCDGAFFRGRAVAVIGGGNTALEDAEVLSGIAEKVYLVHRRDTFRGEQTGVKRLQAKDNVEFVMNSVPVELLGDSVISGLRVRNVETDEERVLPVQGIFIAIGQMPDNEDFSELVELDKGGYIIAGENCVTGAEGIFTAGDCRTKKVRQLATAAADGAVAALAASEYISRMESE